ncbi:MAG: hypothetical protein ACRYFZ_19730 [Janthinobacterium lividum]
METLQIGATTKQVPATWNELKRKQLLQLLVEVYSEPRPGRRLRLLALLSGFPPVLLANLPEVVLAQLLPLADWVDSDNHRLTAQLLPTLHIPGRHVAERPTTWHGPRESFRNLLFGEFIFADTFFALYCLHGKPQFLDQFLTVLYRPARRDASPERADWNGDVRLAFNEHQLETRTPRVFRVAPLEKLAVVAWYRGCRAQLAQEFPDVFVAADEDAGASAKKAPDWSRVLRKLSGEAFGPVQQTAGQPVRLILAEMQDLAADYQRQKNRTNA